MKELLEMLEGGIIEACEVPTDWNTKAFPVIKGDRVSVCLVGEKVAMAHRKLQSITHTS